MSEDQDLPAYSQPFLPSAIRELAAIGPLAEITPEWAWGGSTGKGVKVAVVDSGIEHDHPAVGGMVRGGVVVEWDETLEDRLRYDPDEHPIDVAGHGTGCAGIIHKLAPEAELYSVRVLGTNMSGRAWQFGAGVNWAIENGMDVVNLSLFADPPQFRGGVPTFVRVEVYRYWFAPLGDPAWWRRERLDQLIRPVARDDPDLELIDHRGELRQAANMNRHDCRDFSGLEIEVTN